MVLTAIVKPTHECNLSCKYCYVEDSAEQGRMSDETLKNILEGVSRYPEDKCSHFIWHGGEPLLMKLNFFKQIAKISNQLRKEGYNINNSIQTNGTLITDELLDLIEMENDFQLGLSLDGPKEINDKTRIYSDGRGAFEEIHEGIRKINDRTRLGKIHLGGGIIVVLNRNNIADIERLYNFFKNERINIKVNPLINSGSAKKKISDLEVTPLEYGKAMLQLFDLWIDDSDSIDIDPFTMIIGNLMTGIPVGCNYSASCRKNFISIGPKGDIYPCGRFDGLKDFWMGNIDQEGGLENALGSEIQKRLFRRTIKTISGCDPCKYNQVCNGGCMHNAYSIGDVMGKDNYCVAYKMIFRHIENFLHEELTKAEVKNEK